MAAAANDPGAREALEENPVEMVLDWLAVGLDPGRATLFQQSAVKEHAELYLLLGMLTPVPWLERNPTYKEQREQLQDRDLSTYGFLGYPLLQAADVLMYKAWGVPVGNDQAPHIELAREIARRFNATYGDTFPEPQTLLSDAPRIAGTDGRKMSKTYGNAVYLTDPAKEVEGKLSRMITDPRRARRTDPGDPNDCPAFQSFHRHYCTPEELRYQEEGCRTAGIGCLECKQIMIKHVQAELEPIRARRARLKPADARAALEAGNASARAERVQQLVEYQRFREVAVALGERNVLSRDVFAGPGEPMVPGADHETPVRDASLADLLDALRDVLERIRPPRAHDIQREGLSIRACVARILAGFVLGPRRDFASLFGPDADRAEVIVIFLALLELIRLRVVRARQAERFGAITLELAVGTVEEATERVRDLGQTEQWRGGEGQHGDGRARDR